MSNRNETKVRFFKVRNFQDLWVFEKGNTFIEVSEVSLNLFEQRSKVTTKLQNKIQLPSFNVKNEEKSYTIFLFHNYSIMMT
jgi:hypothetical protein